MNAFYDYERNLKACIAACEKGDKKVAGNRLAQVQMDYSRLEKYAKSIYVAIAKTD